LLRPKRRLADVFHQRSFVRMTSGRRTGQLHLNRITASGTIYFVTGCTHHRQQSLVGATIANNLLAAVQDSDCLKDTKTFAFTVMPDHSNAANGSRLVASLLVLNRKRASCFGSEAWLGGGTSTSTDCCLQKILKTTRSMSS
jgi:hypothetical protein